MSYKKDKYENIAKEMYVKKFITVSEIAKRLGINERTIRRWKNASDWKKKEKRTS